jgi:alkanesulfonate monooxygenase SsuD/methylene tetrahydromethanopterin reductase-like flavin-dependent oxidoreductase (luciferase family)
MRIGIGLPNLIPDVPGQRIAEWAIRAEARGFSSLVTTDRVVYPGHDPLLSLALAAAVTSRVRLLTDVLLAPLHSPGMLARDAATVYQASGARLALGVAPGVRQDDFVVAEREFHARFRRFDADLELMHRVWQGKPVPGTDRSPVSRPLPAGGVPLLIGGFSDGAIQRIVRWGSGWVAPSLGLADVLPFAERVRAAWREAGRSGDPEIVAMTRFGIGADVAAMSRESARDYFAILGDELAEVFAEDAARDEETVREIIGQYAAAGIDELIFNPTVAELSQVDRLADACGPMIG